MNIRSFSSATAAALTAAVLLFLGGIAPAQTQKPGRPVLSEEGAARLPGPLAEKYRATLTEKARQPAPGAAAPAAAASLSGYPHYQLIDLGTLGGPFSQAIGSSRGVNNRGQMMAFAHTDVVDPDCHFDCYVGHAVQRLPNGQIVDLPFPSGIDAANNTSWPNDLAPDGLLAGWVANGEIDPLTGFSQVRPVVWGSGGVGVWNLGTFGGNSGQATMVNRYGASVGEALNDVAENPDFASYINGEFPAATQARAFLWDGSGLQDLGTLGGNDAVAVAINDAGIVLGMSYTDTVISDATGLPTTHPFLWIDGQLQDLGSLGGTFAKPGSFGGGPFAPSSLNERGQAIGTSFLAGDEVWHAFLWDNGTMTDLGTLGGELSEAFAINQRGWVVGRAEFSMNSHLHHAVLWRNGTGKDLGIVAPCTGNSTAFAVNSSGNVVGGVSGCTGDPNDPNYFSAFIWSPGKTMVDLNSLVTPPSDIHIPGAESINDNGEIAVQLILPNGEQHAGLLVPVRQ